MTPLAMQLLGLQGPMLPDQRVCTGTGKCFTMSARERERDSLPEAIGYVTLAVKVTWPLERTDQYTV